MIRSQSENFSEIYWYFAYCLSHFCLSEIDHFGKAELQLCNTVTLLDCHIICVVASERAVRGDRGSRESCSRARSGDGRGAHTGNAATTAER